MRISKISSKATYHKCLKNLHALGYIEYQPSYNPFRGSHVILFNFADDLKPLSKSERKTKNELLFEQVTEQALNKSCTSSGTGTEQALVPSINYVNNTNSLNKKNVSNLEKHAKKLEEINNTSEDNIKPNCHPELVEGSQKEKSSAKKEMFSTFDDTYQKQTQNSREKEESSHTELVEVPPNQKLNPDIEYVKTYFQENNFPELEAQKFYNYFKSVGWLIGGKIPMADWQAAAQNWMLNTPKFISNAEQPNRAKNLNTTTDKDYSEPL
jgi:hypothetical protein